MSEERRFVDGLGFSVWVCEACGRECFTLPEYRGHLQEERIIEMKVKEVPVNGVRSCEAKVEL